VSLSDDDPYLQTTFQHAYAKIERSDTTLDLKGESWPACYENHCRVRKFLSENDVEIPDTEVAVNSLLIAARTEAEGKPCWMDVLPAREIDVLAVHLYMHSLYRACADGDTDAIGCSIPPVHDLPDFHWDLTNNVWMGRHKHKSTEGLLPCITKGHRLWNVKKMRPWLGKELLRAQGFPKDVKTTFNEDDQHVPAPIKDAISQRLGRKDITDMECMKLAGNTMTVPLMMLLQVYLEIHISWPKTPPPKPG
jgi:hypothetical protein